MCSQVSVCHFQCATAGVFFYNASRGNLTALSSLTFLTPMFAALAGYFVLGETFTPLQLTGAHGLRPFSSSPPRKAIASCTRAQAHFKLKIENRRNTNKRCTSAYLRTHARTHARTLMNATDECNLVCRANGIRAT